MKTIASHLREQAERYDRLAHRIGGQQDGAFMRAMADGYFALADRHDGDHRIVPVRR